jgi:hypothetical protein
MSGRCRRLAGTHIYAGRLPITTSVRRMRHPLGAHVAADLCGWSVFGVIEEIAQNGSICQLGRRSRNKCYQQRSPCGLRLPETITDWPGGSPTATAFTVPWWPVSGASTGSPDSRLQPHRLVEAAGNDHWPVVPLAGPAPRHRGRGSRRCSAGWAAGREPSGSSRAGAAATGRVGRRYEP